MAMSSADNSQSTPPPPPTPPPLIENNDKLDDENKDIADDVIDAAMNVKFMADTEQEAEEERATHPAFDVKQQHRWEAATV
jgi:hypothetical protein